MCYHPEFVSGLTSEEARLGNAEASRRMHRELYDDARTFGPASRAWKLWAAHVRQHKAQAAEVRRLRIERVK